MAKFAAKIRATIEVTIEIDAITNREARDFINGYGLEDAATLLGVTPYKPEGK